MAPQAREAISAIRIEENPPVRAGFRRSDFSLSVEGHRHMPTSRKTATPSIAELLCRAKINILTGENHFRKAAEDIAAAAERGATQRKIAAGVGRSVAWVNQLLQWRESGYQETPFGPQSKAKRERAAVVQAPEQATPQDSPFDPAKTKSVKFDITHRTVNLAAPTLTEPEDVEPDEAPPIADDGTETSVEQLIGALTGLTFYVNRQQHPAWPMAIEAIGGSVELHKLITKLQAAYDEHCTAEVN
jgi:hypothetical protein